MGAYRELRVWREAHDLTLSVYKETVAFPKEERYALTGQIRRASVSIPANIAEGCGRAGDRELIRFLRISMGSANELEYHLLLAKDLGLLSTDGYHRLSNSVTGVKQMLSGLIKNLSTTKEEKRQALDGRR